MLNLGERIWPITPGTVPDEVTAEQLSGEEAVRESLGSGSATASDLQQPTARRRPPPPPPALADQQATGRPGPLLYVAEGSQFSTYVFDPLVEEVPAPEADVIPLLEPAKSDDAEKEPELEKGPWVPYDKRAFFLDALSTWMVNFYKSSVYQSFVIKNQFLIMQATTVFCHHRLEWRSPSTCISIRFASSRTLPPS